MKVRLYSASVIAVAAMAITAILGSSQPLDLALIAVLGALSFLAEWLAFSIPYGGTVSLAFPMHFAAVLLGGPTAGMLVALMSSVSPQDIRARKGPLRLAFNAAQLSLAAALSGLVFVGLGGRPLLESGAGSLSSGLLGPALAAAAVQAFVNMSLVAVAMSLASGASLREVWTRSFSSYLISLLAMALLGLVFAQLVATAGYWSLVLLLVPFFVARQTFRVYEQQSEAYLATVKSLIEALEAKDPYTRGHSERVAEYAVGLARELALQESEIRRIEWAALLHDIGKIAISSQTLTKPSALTDAEFERIREHPLTAVHILQGIGFLADIIPMISAHHERADGTGYPYGLPSASVPAGAKILAVADAFDAMTSTRAYRPPMSYTAAIAELRSVSGAQLDADCVDAFVAWFEASVRADSVETSGDAA